MKTQDTVKMPKLLKISDVAKLLNVTPLTLRNWDKKGLLVSIRLGTRRDRRYKEEDITNFIEELKV